jgi:ATP-dependent Clp protease ATP-binding subunit ClpA
MFERFDDARRWILPAAQEEAQRRGDRRLGTDHLLLALFHDPQGLAAGALGTDLAGARAAADALDRAALAAVGIELGEELQPVPAAGRRRPPFTSGARNALVLSVAEARRARGRRIQARHLLLALLGKQRPDPAGQLLDALGVDAEAARARLAAPGP